MRGPIAVVALHASTLLAAWEPSRAVAQPAIDWSLTYAYESDYSGRESALGSELTIVGTVASFSGVLADFDAGGAIEYSFHIAGLRSNGTLASPGGPGGTWTVYTTEYCGGTFVIYEDSTRDAAHAAFPPNTDVPSTFSDGTEFLVGVVPKIVVTFYYEGATYRGGFFDSGVTFPYQPRFTGGAQFDRVRRPDGSSCEVRFSGAWYVPVGDRPPGYTGTLDGKIDVTCAIFCNPCVTAELDATVITDPSCVRQGGAINIAGGRFSPDSDVALRLFGPDDAEIGAPYQLVHTDWCGAFSTSIATTNGFQTGEYRIQAEDLATGEALGPYTFHVMPVDPPSSSTNLRVTNLGTGTSLRIEWDQSTSQHVVGYRLCRSRSGVPGTTECWDLPAAPLEYEDLGLERQVEYAYEIRSRDHCSEGASSTAIAQTPDYYPVLLVHGICGNARGFSDCTLAETVPLQAITCDVENATRLGDRLRQAGFRVYVAQYDNDARLLSQVPRLWSIVNGVREATGEARVNVVTHSQGGLISRAMLKSVPDAQLAVARLVMLAPPNHGAFLANIRLPLGCRFGAPAKIDLTPGSEFLNWLNYSNEQAPYDVPHLVPCSPRHAELLPVEPPMWVLSGTGTCTIGGELCSPSDGVVTQWSAFLAANDQFRQAADVDLPLGASFPRARHSGFIGLCVPWLDETIDILKHPPIASAVWYLMATGALPPNASVGGHLARVAGHEQGGSAILPYVLLPSSEASLSAGTVQRDTARVDGTGELVVVQDASRPYFALRIISPSGATITVSDSARSDVDYVEDDAHLSRAFRIVNPESGGWTIESEAPLSIAGTAPCRVQPMLQSGVAFRLEVQDTTGLGPKTKVLRGLEAAGGAAFVGAIVEVVVHRPDGIQETIQLHDDGEHGDGGSGDGSFAATYDPPQAGFYELDGTASGAPPTNLERRAVAVFSVETAENLSLSRADVVLTPAGGLDSLNIEVSVHNLGASEAPAARVRVTSAREGDIADREVPVPAGGVSTTTLPWLRKSGNPDTLQVTVDANFAFLEDRLDDNVVAVPVQEALVDASLVPLEAALKLDVMPVPASGVAVHLSFAAPIGGHAIVKIYDVVGRLIAVPFDGPLTAGRHAIVWNRRTRDGQVAQSGVYFARLTCGGRQSTTRLVLIR